MDLYNWEDIWRIISSMLLQLSENKRRWNPEILDENISSRDGDYKNTSLTLLM